MKRDRRFEMRVSDKLIEDLDRICEHKAGIRTRAAAVEYCVSVVMMGIGEKKKEESEKEDK